MQPTLIVFFEFVGRPGDVAVGTKEQPAHRLLRSRGDDGVHAVCRFPRRGCNRATGQVEKNGAGVMQQISDAPPSAKVRSGTNRPDNR